MITLSAFIQQPIKGINSYLAGRCFFVNKNFKVIFVKAAASWRTKIFGKRFSILIGKTQVVDTWVLIVGDANDNSPGCTTFIVSVMIDRGNSFLFLGKKRRNLKENVYTKLGIAW